MYTNTESIGCVAHKIVSVSPTATVIGRTSRGLFLRAATKQILFISFEPHRGPLTINTVHKITSRGQSVQITASHLFIGEAAICLNPANLWHPAPAPTHIVSLPQRLATLQHFLHRAKVVIPRSAQRDEESLGSSQRFLASLGITNSAESLILNLGLGPGLTPSGDDVVIGFLLTLNRYGRYPHNDLLIKEARTRTTTLSANLIECAAQGLADERLLRVVDCVFTGNINDHALDELLGWGESSGRNVLIGIALAVRNFSDADPNSQTRI